MIKNDIEYEVTKRAARMFAESLAALDDEIRDVELRTIMQDAYRNQIDELTGQIREYERPKHCCGAQGFGQSPDDSCPACDAPHTGCGFGTAMLAALRDDPGVPE